MKKTIGMYEITSNLKKCKSLGFGELTPKQQEYILNEFDYVDDIEGSYFVFEHGSLLPMEEITNFEINTIPSDIRDYFYNTYPDMYCGVGRDGVYLQDSTIFVVSKFQEWYIKFNIK